MSCVLSKIDVQSVQLRLSTAKLMVGLDVIRIKVGKVCRTRMRSSLCCAFPLLLQLMQGCLPFRSVLFPKHDEEMRERGKILFTEGRIID